MAHDRKNEEQLRESLTAVLEQLAASQAECERLLHFLRRKESEWAQQSKTDLALVVAAEAAECERWQPRYGRAVGVLRELLNKYHQHCPYCDAKCFQQHKPSCKLAAVLAEADAAKEANDARTA